MKKTILVFLFLTAIMRAQEKIALTLYFQTNTSQLSSEGKKMLEATLKKMRNKKAYLVRISGHTDNEGTLTLNERLSLQRVNTVKSYLLKRGFPEDKIIAKACSYSKPAADNLLVEGRTKNRRVNIDFDLIKPEPGKVLGHVLAVSNYILKTSEESYLAYSSGTKIHVPAQAFEFADGSPASGTINLSYVEYRNKLDFISCGIPMSFKNEEGEFVQFNSAGMFKIEAAQNKKALKLKHGKRIDVDFVKTQDVDDMGIYKFNTSSSKWTKPSELNSDAGPGSFTFNSKFIFSKGYEPRSFVSIGDGVESCLLQPCYGTAFIARKGLQFASTAPPLNIYKPGAYFKSSISPSIPRYKMKVVSRKGNKVRFCVIGEGNSLSKILGSYVWEYTNIKGAPFKEEWVKTVWVNFKSHYLSGKDFYLSFRSNSENLRLALKLYENTEGGKASLVNTWNAATDLASSNELPRMDPVELSPSGRLYNNALSDSLYCFYTLSKEWMPDSTGEKNMSFPSWFDFFNSNKAMMKTRYAQLIKKSDENKPDCIAKEKELMKEKRRRDSIAWTARNAQQITMASLKQNLSIPDLGIWNCDQVFRLKEPVYVQSNYKDEKGNKVSPLSIYVIDPDINGILAYSGDGKMGPYDFPLSSKAENTLLAFDESGNVFVCKPADLAKCINEPRQSILVEQVAKADLAGVINRWLK